MKRAKSREGVAEPHTAAAPARGQVPLLAGVVAAMFGVAVTMAPGGYNPFGPAKAFVLLAAAACVSVGFAIAPERLLDSARRIFAQRATWPALALLGLAGLATLTSVDPSQSLTGHYPEYQGLLLLVVSALVGLGAYALTRCDDTWRVIGRAATVGVLIVAAYGVAQFAGLDPVVWSQTLVVRRVLSTLGNASNLGVFLCLALPLVLAAARAEANAWRWAAWTAVGVGAMTLTWSLSRGAWIGALAGAAVWLLVEGRAWDRRTRVRIAGVALAVAILAVALTVALVPSASRRLSALADPSSGTAGWRVQVWGATSRLVAQRPVLGYGPATFRYVFPPVRTAAMQVGETGIQTTDDPHNLFASAAVSAGVLALLALAWLLGETIAAAWRLPAGDRWRFAAPALTASVTAGVVALQFHFATVDTAPLLAGVIGLALGRSPGAQAATPTDSQPSARTRTTVRAVAAAVAAILIVAAGLAAGLTLADRRIARGYALVSARAPWTEAKRQFESAEALAPWEPAMPWALGRAATQAVAGGQGAALGDATRALASASARLPLDSLLVAQDADVYLVAGETNHDASALRLALPLAEKAIALDPQDGYRWAAKGTALAGLGDVPEAVAALERAVQYAPNDRQAWTALATLYQQMGQPNKAAAARQHAMSGQ